MTKYHILKEIRKLLFKKYKDYLINGFEQGVSEPDFILEQVITTTEKGQSLLQRRIIAIMAVECARFRDNVKILENSICKNLGIQPRELTLVMVTSSQKNCESSRVSRGDANGATFCKLDDLCSTIKNYSDVKPIFDYHVRSVSSPTQEVERCLKSALRAINVKTQVGTIKAEFVARKSSTIFPNNVEKESIEPEGIMEKFCIDAASWRMLTWNLQIGQEGAMWDVCDVVKLANDHDACFFQEVPTKKIEDLIEKLKENFWPILQKKEPLDEGFGMIAFIRKKNEERSPWKSDDVFVNEASNCSFVRAMVIKPCDEQIKIALVNVHVPTDSLKQCQFIKDIYERTIKLTVAWICGDFNRSDLSVTLNQGTTQYMRNNVRQCIDSQFYNKISKVFEMHPYSNPYHATYTWTEKNSKNWKQMDFIMGLDPEGKSWTVFNPPLPLKNLAHLGNHYPVSNSKCLPKKITVCIDEKSIIIDNPSVKNGEIAFTRKISEKSHYFEDDGNVTKFVGNDKKRVVGRWERCE